MRKSRMLFVENLEGRAMLAGNVMVSVDGGGALNISGDNLSNGVSVQELGNGKFFVSGFNLNNGTTTINGQANGQVFSGVTDDVRVALANGYDVFVMSNSAFRRQQLADQLSNNTAGNVQTSPVAPSNTTHSVTSRVFGDLLIDMGNGNDGVGFGARVGTRNANGDLTRGGVINVATGDGADRVLAARSEAFDDMIFNMGSGNDSVNADVARVGDFLLGDMGDGNDRYVSNNAHGFHSQVYGGAGNDNIQVSDYFFEEEVFLNGGDGNNNISANGLSGSNLNITTGSGTDNINVQRARSYDDFIVNTGAGNDFVRLNNVQVDDVLSVSLLDGDDTLRISNSSSYDTNLDGGADFDRLFDDGGNALGSPNVSGFEA